MIRFPEKTGNVRSIPGFSRTKQNHLLQVTSTQYSDFNQSVIMNFLRFLCWLCMVVCTDKLDKLDNFCEGRAICEIEFTGFKRYVKFIKNVSLKQFVVCGYYYIFLILGLHFYLQRCVP